MWKFSLLSVGVAMVLAATMMVAQSRGVSTGISISIPTPPSAFRGDAQWRLCYEIYITNLSVYSWTVQNIEVANQSGTPLLTVQGKEPKTVLFHPALPPASKG